MYLTLIFTSIFTSNRRMVYSVWGTNFVTDWASQPLMTSVRKLVNTPVWISNLCSENERSTNIWWLLRIPLIGETLEYLACMCTMSWIHTHEVWKTNTGIGVGQRHSAWNWLLKSIWSHWYQQHTLHALWCYIVTALLALLPQLISLYKANVTNASWKLSSTWCGCCALVYLKTWKGWWLI